VRAAGIAVHVELGNEVWNSQFRAHSLSIAQEKATGALPAVAKPTGQRWYGYRAAQVSRVIQAAGWKIGRDFRMALGCFTNLPDQAVAVWAGVTAAGGTDADFSDWSISSYIHGDVVADFAKTVAMTKAGDLDTAFATIQHGPSSSPDWAAAKILPKHKAIADAHGLGLVVYEGNTSFYAIPNFADSALVSKGTGITKAQVVDFFAKIMRDPRAADVMTANLKACSDAGVKLFCAFNDQGGWGENGLWGLYGTPGWDAMMKWIASNRPKVDLAALAAEGAAIQRQVAEWMGKLAAAAIA